VGILDFRCLEETAQQGYEYAMGALDRLPAGSPVRRFVDRAAPERGA
jgi:hypothetical protein